MEHECEQFVPKAIIRANIGMMIFYTLSNVLILLWMATRLTVSPEDVEATFLREAVKTEAMLDQVDRRLILIEEKLTK